MRSRDCFGVVVRSLGLVIVLLGVYNVFTSLYLPLDPDFPHRHLAVGGLVVAAFFGLVGLALMRGATSLVRFCYPLERGERSERAETLGNPPAV